MSQRTKLVGAIGVRLTCGLALGALSVYALNKGSGFWNYAYAIAGAAAAFSSLFMAAVLIWATRFADDDPP